MADNKVLIEVVVTDKGLRLSQKNIDNLTDSVDKSSKKTKEAKGSAEDLFSTQNKGIIGTANSTKSFSKLAQTIGSDGSGLVGAYAALAANAFAISAAFNALNNAAQATSLLEGLEAQGARTGRTLSVLSDKLKSIAKDSISTAEAMRATSQGSTSGISSGDLEKLTKVAYEASLALGRDVPDSLNRMMLAVTKMEPELVDELGLTTKITEASEKYARQNNITVGSMNQMQKQQALLNAWTEQGTMKFGGLAEAVDPNPYNQLSATFKDLINSGLGVVNLLLKPLVSFLSSSQTILLGFSTLFISSIRGQIIPGLQDASKAALEAAEANKKAAISELEDQKSLGAGRRKAINTYIMAAKEGIATQEQFTAAMAESQIREDNAAKLKAATYERIQKQEIARRSELESIQTHQSKVLLEEAKAQGYAASEGVSLINAKSKLKDTLKALSNSFTVNYEASKNNEKGLKGLHNTAVSAGKGIAAAGKVAAIGFLNFLPVIGQLIAGISILWEWIGKPVFYKLTGQTEESIKAFEDFSTVLESTSKKIDGLKKIEASSASASDRAVAAVKNQTATIYELAEAYTAVYEARKKDKPEKESDDRSGAMVKVQQQIIEANRQGNMTALKSLTEQRQLIMDASRLSVSSSTQAAQAFQTEASGLWLSNEAEAAAQYLDNLEQQMPTVAKAFYDAQGGAKKFNDLDSDKKLELVAKQAGVAATALRRIESGFDSLAKSISTLNTGYTDFIKSISPTTAYDGILDKFKSFSNSLRDVNKAIGESDIGTSSDDLNKRLSETLTGIKGDARNIFTIDVQADLSVFDDIDYRLASLKEKQKEQREGSIGYIATAKEINAAETKRSAILTSITPKITKQALEYKSLLNSAQIQSIVAQGNLSIAQAHLGVIQKQGIVTADDVEKQMRAENAILALQAEQLKVQKTFLDIDIQRQKSRIQELQDTLDILKALKDVTAEKEAQNAEDKISALQAKIKASSRDPSKSQEVARAESQIVVLESAKLGIAKEQEKVASDIAERQEDLAVKSAASANIAKQMAAILMGSNSEAEIQAARAKKNLENNKQALDILRDTASVKQSIFMADAESYNLLNYSQKALGLSLVKIEDTNTLKKRGLKEEWEARKSLLTIDRNLASVRGNQSQVDHYNRLLVIEKQRFDVSMELADSEQHRDKLQLALIKTIEEEVDLRKEAANIQQQVIQASAENIKAQLDYNSAVLALEVKRRGITDKSVQDYNNLKSAEVAYEIAVAEFGIKKSLIMLEFMLLDSKRNLLITELGQRKKILEGEKAVIAKKLDTATIKESAKKPDPEYTGHDGIIVEATKGSPIVERLNKELVLIDENIGSIDLNISSLSKIDTSQIMQGANLAVDTLIKNLDILKLKMEEAATRGPLLEDTFSVRSANMGARETGRSASFDKTNIIAGTEIENARRSELKDPLPGLTPEEIKERAGELRLLGESASTGLSKWQQVGITIAEEMDSYISQISENLKGLGPEGEVVLAIASAASNIGSVFLDTFQSIQDGGSKTVASLQIMSAVIAGVASILKSVSDSKIAGIDKEIAAEERRDGKSAASVEKIKAMQKKKDETARKSFNIQKKLMMAQAVVSTAAAIAMTLGQLGPIAGPIMAGVIGAMGLAQIAIISGTQYESANASSISTPSSISIGKRSDTVDLAKGPNANAGGEAGYLRGSQGSGSNASNYNTVGSAYGGELMRGYGNRGFIVGEKGPERINPETPITVTPANDVGTQQPLNATFNIQALDSSGVQDLLVAQKGNIIKMLRDAANASGKSFMEDVNTNVYLRPSVGKL